MTKKQLFIYNYLLENKDRFVSPTEIGIEYGKTIYKNGIIPLWFHSNMASKTCHKLVQLGYIEKNKKGHYKFIKPY